MTSSTLQAVILAGGLGTRLRSVVADRPKVLAPVNGRPFLAWMLDELVRQGFERITLAVGYLGEQVEAAFGGRHCAPGMSQSAALAYSHESSPLGTGGAVQLAFETLPDAATFVMNGDTYLRLNWRDMLADHLTARTSLSIAVRAVSDVARYGAVSTDDEGRVVAFGEKSGSGPGLINAGVYLLDHGALAAVRNTPTPFSIETDLISRHLPQLRPRAHRFDGPFLDIGVPDDFRRAGDFIDALPSLEPSR